MSTEKSKWTYNGLAILAWIGLASGIGAAVLWIITGGGSFGIKLLTAIGLVCGAYNVTRYGPLRIVRRD